MTKTKLKPRPKKVFQVEVELVAKTGVMVRAHSEAKAREAAIEKVRKLSGVIDVNQATVIN